MSAAEQQGQESLAALGAQLEQSTPQEIVQWAVQNYFPKLTMATAFGPEGCCLLHMIAEIEPRLYLFNLDTGYQFAETLELLNRFEQRYGLKIELVQPELTVERYEDCAGGPLYKSDPDQCCHDRKIVPLRNKLKDYSSWITAIRRDQSPFRKNAGIVEWDTKFGLVKINPLVNWKKTDVWKFITDNDVPYNPLHDQGYPSIGCWPCTRAVKDGEDERAGRWSGRAKTECGLHLRD